MNLKELFAEKDLITQEIAKGKEALKEIDAKINELVAKEFEASRKSQDKHYGALTLNLNGTTVKQSITKKVEWDQDKLRECKKALEAANVNPEEYMGITYKVAEKDFNRLPEGPKKWFAEARTIKSGSVKLELVEDAE